MKPSSPLPVPLFLPLLAGMAAISFAPILVRLSDAPVSVQGMYRMLFTIAIMLPLGTGRLPSARAIAGKDWLLLGAAGFFLALHFLLWMSSLNYTSIASSTIILSLQPVFVMLGALIAFKDKPNRFALLGMAVGLTGAIIVGTGDKGASHAALSGDILSFLSVIAIAVNLLIAKRILTRVSTYLYNMIVFAICLLFFTVYNWIMNIPITGYAGKEWFVFLLLAVVPTMLGHMVFNWLLKYVQPTTISMAVFAEPVGASLLGMLIFSEMVTGFQLIGGAFVIAGLIVYLRSERLAAGRGKRRTTSLK